MPLKRGQIQRKKQNVKHNTIKILQMFTLKTNNNLKIVSKIKFHRENIRYT